jgi:teichuronic acid biosynthesis glycosyltransferase TuaC
MNILFISSGNSTEGISPIIVNQGKSLSELGHKVDYFLIKGHGIKGYIKNIGPLRKTIKKNEYDVYHAHFLWSAIIALISGAKPLIVSLMGSDVNKNNLNRFLSNFFSHFWRVTIVKSEEMKIRGKLKHAIVLPNGVNFNRFKPIEKNTAIQYVKWNSNNKHVLFAADPEKTVKNFKLAKQAFEILNNQKVECHSLKNINNEEVPYYLNAADVILLTSLYEGSPNVIKEAMACNRPIVATDCGDIKDVTRKTNGCYITKYDAVEISESLKKALELNDVTTGRNDIQYLNSEKIASRLIGIYTDNLILLRKIN